MIRFLRALPGIKHRVEIMIQLNEEDKVVKLYHVELLLVCNKDFECNSLDIPVFDLSSDDLELKAFNLNQCIY